ncbi:hypothetical protein HID58_059429, partial [Brassica napus]
SSNQHPGIHHSTFKSLRLGHSSQSIAFGFLRFWDSLNFKKYMEFVRIMVLFLDEKTSVIDSSLPGIALTMISGKKKILLLKKTLTTLFIAINSPFQAEHQMEANFSGSFSTTRQNQKIDVGGRLIKGILRRSEKA